MSRQPVRAESRSEPSTGTLGTFSGVFTPSVLTILGIILFLRLGYVVGAAGLLRALLIILLANLISVATSVSLSAVATNLSFATCWSARSANPAGDREIGAGEAPAGP